MSVQVRCSCGMEKSVPEEYVGKKGKCPACGTVFRMQAVGAQTNGHDHRPADAVTEDTGVSLPSDLTKSEEREASKDEERWRVAKEQGEEALRRAKVAAGVAAVATGKAAKEGAALSKATFRWAWPRVSSLSIAAWRWLWPRFVGYLAVLADAASFALSGDGRAAIRNWAKGVRTSPGSSLMVALSNGRVRVLAGTMMAVACVAWMFSGERESNDAAQRLPIAAANDSRTDSSTLAVHDELERLVMLCGWSEVDAKIISPELAAIKWHQDDVMIFLTETYGDRMGAITVAGLLRRCKEEGLSFAQGRRAYYAHLAEQSGGQIDEMQQTLQEALGAPQKKSVAEWEAATPFDVRKEWPTFATSGQEFIEGSRYGALLSAERLGKAAGAAAEGRDESLLEEFIAAYELVTGKEWTGSLDQSGLLARQTVASVVTALTGMQLNGNAIPGVAFNRSGWVEAVALRGTHNTDWSLSRLAKLRHLKWLDLSGIDAETVSETGLESLAACRTLEYLSLAGLKVNVETLNHVGRLPQLRMLVLSGSRVDDRGLAELDGLSELEELWVDYTRVTLRGIERLSGLAKLSVVFALPNDYSVSEATAVLSRMEGQIALQPFVDLEMKTPPSLNWSIGLRMVLGETFYELHNATPSAGTRLRWAEEQYEPLRYWNAAVPAPQSQSGNALPQGADPRTMEAMGALPRWKLALLPRVWTSKGETQGPPDGFLPPNAPSLPSVGLAGQLRLPGETGYVAPRPPEDYRGSDLLPYLVRGWDADVQWISLAKVKCSDEDLERLSRYQELRALDLSGSPVTGEGLLHLAAARELRYLNLSNTAFSDKHANVIAETFPKLTTLDCRNSKLTASGAKQLEAANSVLEVSFGNAPQ